MVIEIIDRLEKGVEDGTLTLSELDKNLILLKKCRMDAEGQENDFAVELFTIHIDRTKALREKLLQNRKFEIGSEMVKHMPGLLDLMDYPGFTWDEFFADLDEKRKKN
jgi:hypothetical protein